MYGMKNIIFPPGTEEMAIKYAAYDIMRQLYNEGKITEMELNYLAQKYDIPVVKSGNKDYNDVMLN